MWVRFMTFFLILISIICTEAYLLHWLYDLVVNAIFDWQFDVPVMFS